MVSTTPRLRHFALAALLLPSYTSSPLALAETALRYNPFAPATVQAKPARPISKAQTRPSQRALPHQHPRLRATLAAANNAVANLDGVILKVGESHKGYRLLAVQEHSAHFAYGPHKVTLTVASARES